MVNALFRPPDPDVLLYPHEEAEPMGQTSLHFLFVTMALDFLRFALRRRDDVFLVADQFLYYVEGQRGKCIAPDVAVYLGVGPHPRRVWKVWEEGGKVPDLAIEVLSDSSLEDIGKKRVLYSALGVGEYLVLDPERLLIPEGIRAYRLEEGELERVRPTGGRVWLATVGISVGVDDGHLQAWDAEGRRIGDLDALASRVEDQESELAAKESELAAKESELAAKESELAEKESEIAALRARLALLDR